MLRLTKGDLTRFDDKVYMVYRITFNKTHILLRKERLAVFDSREKALSYLNSLDIKQQDEDCYYRVKEVSKNEK